MKGGNGGVGAADSILRVVSPASKDPLIVSAFLSWARNPNQGSIDVDMAAGSSRAAPRMLCLSVTAELPARTSMFAQGY